LLYGYFKVGDFFVGGFLQLKNKVMRLSSKIQHYIMASA
jgi:hypothetical protein